MRNICLQIIVYYSNYYYFLKLKHVIKLKSGKKNTRTTQKARKREVQVYDLCDPSGRFGVN